MTGEETLALLEETGALLEGHFLLSSGLHSDRYVQCALALSRPAAAERLGRGVAGTCAGLDAGLVAGPALGGIIIAHEVARALNLPCVFSERAGGAMTLRRGFAVEPGVRVLLVEDVVTTGKSVLELAEVVRDAGGVVAGFACVVDRSGGRSRLPEPPRSLATLASNAYPAEDCPLCRKGSAPVKPGSRPGPAAG